ncbi:hypothetical protein SUGI_0218850 [Cryptomeria japonica]|uniref:protein LURP-one-related 12-like n=1 Tax=Cryptomeria japonica TaxID=3369 RepID=UPI0024089424|nr:protein LURP-one-related 12-like [Cryptomeria japonica]GLJ13715.1 hypothetical protein SUGI_0218850 [Cryptomeria japonica]
MSNIYPHQAAQATGRSADLQLFTVWKKAFLFSGTGFTVFDSSGNLVLRVEDYTPTVKRQLLVMDASGNPLLLLRRKVMSLHHRWEGFICKEKGKLWVFTIKRSSIISATTSVDVFLTSSNTNSLGRRFDYHIEGSFRERSCAIYNRSRSMVAQVKRKKSCDMLLEKDVFSVEIYRNFDPALIMSWIAVVDHINSEDLRVVTQAALYCTFRSYQLLKIVDMKRKGDCIAKGVPVKEASAHNKTFQHEAMNACIIHS